MNKKIYNLTINLDNNILSALKQMDSFHVKLLIVINNGKFYSLLSIGDIQRAIIANVSLLSPIRDILRDNVKVASINDTKEDIVHRMKQNRNDFMPIINDNNDIIDVIFWEDISENNNKIINNKLNLPVVIMAGGKGERLKPLTNVLPKPLIPIGNQTMLEDIIDSFIEYGANNFYISVNYKSETIKRYMSSINKPNCYITFFQEEKPLGTAGSLHLLKDYIQTTFFVSNCDIIIDAAYDEIIDYHYKNKNEITIISAIKTYPIPYGTLETGSEGLLKVLHEKPDVTFKINTGMYVLEPHLLNEIPENSFYHITFLIEKLCKENRRVGVFPISENSWTDIGNWNEYMRYINNYQKNESH